MVEVSGFLKRLLGLRPGPKAERVRAPGGGHLPPGWARPRSRSFLFGHDAVQDYVEARTRYARSVLEQIEAEHP